MSVSAIHSAPRRVSVVIPTWNGGPRFVALLEALAAQDLDDGIELVVVDSGSSDGTPERAAAAGAYVFRIPNSEFNHGGTRNRAIARSHGEIVVLLTQDAVPEGRDFLRRLVASFDGDEPVDGAYARQVPRPDCDPLLAERLRQWMASRTERELHQLAPGDPAAAQARFDELEPMDRLLACAFDNVASAVRRSTWERHPLPERSFGEDVAWAREVLLAGGRIAFEPEAVVEHSHRIEMLREFKRIYCDHRNLLALFGLRNVPSWGAVWKGWNWQRGFYRRLLADMDLPFERKLFWRAYSVPYALLETAAQFLGARSHWKTETSGFWRWADKRIRKGI
ncbi:MAG: glycosyltransferase family 2 protein [Planctomycetota bacterium]